MAVVAWQHRTMAPRDRYTHGHHPTVLRSHTWRTVENSAGYLLGQLDADQRVLDVGCGPGTITIDLGRHVREVVGVDIAEVIAVADGARAEAGVDNVRFVAGDVYGLDFDDDTFDVVHAHQVLQHLSDPVAALREMRRVCRPGGIVAVRDSDYAGFIWAPLDERLDEWLALYRQIARGNDAEPDAGRFLLGWARAAGFADEAVAPSASVWCFATPEDREWWGGMWAERIVDSSVARQAVDRQLARVEDLDAIAAAWRRWAASPDGWFVIPHGEIVCRV